MRFSLITTRVARVRVTEVDDERVVNDSGEVATIVDITQDELVQEGRQVGGVVERQRQCVEHRVAARRQFTANKHVPLYYMHILYMHIYRCRISSYVHLNIMAI